MVVLVVCELMLFVIMMVLGFWVNVFWCYVVILLSVNVLNVLGLFNDSVLCRGVLLSMVYLIVLKFVWSGCVFVCVMFCFVLFLILVN